MNPTVPRQTAFEDISGLHPPPKRKSPSATRKSQGISMRIAAPPQLTPEPGPMIFLILADCLVRRGVIVVARSIKARQTLSHVCEGQSFRNLDTRRGGSQVLTHAGSGCQRSDMPSIVRHCSPCNLESSTIVNRTAAWELSHRVERFAREPSIESISDRSRTSLPVVAPSSIATVMRYNIRRRLLTHVRYYFFA